MKKVIIISIVFAAVLSLGAWEMVYSTRLFCELEDGLIRVRENIYVSGDDIANAETMAAMDEVCKKWEKGREVVFCLGNHNTLRSLDEKITGLKVMIRTNNVGDAKITADTTLSLVKAVHNDTHPVLSNIF